jgi:GWxTD domain-containing protein
MFNKNKFIQKVIFLLLMGVSMFGQQLFSPGFSESHILPSNSGGKVFYLYRIPYNRFVFIKEGSTYKAGFRISIEVTDSVTRHITRQIDEKSFSVDKYEETNSDANYIEGLCTFNIGKSKYHLSPVISDLNSSKEFKLPEAWIERDSSTSKNFIFPFIIQHEKVKCENNQHYKIANFNNSIPFSKSTFDFIIPVLDTNLNSIYALLINNKDTVFKGEVKDYFAAGLLPFECDGNVLLKTSGSIKSTKNFILKNFSAGLDEGALRIVLSTDSSFKKTTPFNLDVKWINKPFTLVNPAEAIKLLKYIEKSSLVDSLLDFSKDKYDRELKNYWKRYDSASHAKFNPLMEEYYSRIDYAMKYYAALSEKNGAETDRGKTYIKYGTPKKIERTSDQDGKMVEKWIYTNSNLVFEFVDQNGAGNYKLKK